MYAHAQIHIPVWVGLDLRTIGTEASESTYIKTQLHAFARVDPDRYLHLYCLIHKKWHPHPQFEGALCVDFSVPPSLYSHVSHFRLVHSKDANFCVVCGINGCGQEFRAFSAYNSHVYRRHRAAVGVNELWSIQDPEPETTLEMQPPTATFNLQSKDIPLECLEPCEELRARTVENPQLTDFSGLPSDYGVQC